MEFIWKHPYESKISINEQNQDKHKSFDRNVMINMEIRTKVIWKFFSSQKCTFTNKIGFKMECRVVLDIFLFLVNEYGGEHDLAKTFNAQR